MRAVMAGSRLFDYYEALDRLSDRLRNSGQRELADRLSDAKSGGSTSGEILSNTGIVLRSLKNDTRDSEILNEATSLLAECDGLWRGMTSPQLSGDLFAVSGGTATGWCILGGLP